MAAGDKCSRCNADYSPVWRRDQATQQKICNRCYRSHKQGLNGTANGDAEGEGGRKRKHRSREEDDDVVQYSETSAPTGLDRSTPPGDDSETEYAAIDLSATPEKLLVKCSGSQKMDGTYWRLQRASRGKPCYAKWMEKRHMYLFWNQKWIIGTTFGSLKSSALLKDTGNLTPCEPYPKAWKIIEKTDKHGGDVEDDGASKDKWVDNLAMRVIDASLEDESLQDEVLALEVPDEMEEEKASRSRKREGGARRTVRAKKGLGTPVEDLEKAGAKAATENAGQSKEPDDLPGPSSEEESDSSSSSSSASPSPEPQRPAAPLAPAPPAGPPPAALLEARSLKESPEKKAADLEEKLREQLLKMRDKASRQEKFFAVQDMLLKRKTVDGIAPEKIQGILDRTQKWLVEVARKAETQAKQGTAELEAVTPAAPVLRKPGGPRQRARRITFRDQYQNHELVRTTPVESHRLLGERLWFSMPGALVVCDSCEKETPQALGSLQGAPDQSQFAQHQFLCSSCSGLQ